MELHLGTIKGTDYWVGMFSSSPKITLLLGDIEVSISKSGKSHEREEIERSEGMNWVCRVCGLSNELMGETRVKCGLCGVIRSTINGPLPKVNKSSPPTPIDNLSLPPSRTATPTPLPILSLPRSIPAPIPVIEKDELSGIVCPVCTFLNHRSMASCEVCSTTLSSVSSTTPDRPRSTSSVSSMIPGLNDSVRLSFRKGGERAFYKALKIALIEKEWEERKLELEEGVKPKAKAGIGESFGFILFSPKGQAGRYGELINGVPRA